MVSGIQTIALFAPAVASNAVFSARRASRGIDAIGDNPVYGAMNMDIAAGQVLKGGRAVKSIAAATGSDLSMLADGASGYMKRFADKHKFLKGAGKVINFTADNINPIICATSGIKVLTSDDKLDTAARESVALSTMFGAEAAAKRILGMPYVEKDEYGNKINKTREALYKKNPFLEKQATALNDYCKTKTALKVLPGALKGLLFVSASILGYKAGAFAVDCILGEEKQSA